MDDENWKHKIFEVVMYNGSHIMCKRGSVFQDVLNRSRKTFFFVYEKVNKKNKIC